MNNFNIDWRAIRVACFKKLRDSVYDVWPGVALDIDDNAITVILVGVESGGVTRRDHFVSTYSYSY